MFRGISRGHQKLTGHQRAPLACCAPIGAGCREVGADVASRAVESKAAAHPSIPDHKCESDVTEVTSAARRSTYLLRKKVDGCVAA
jgi:hypothetical protein